ncbi:MAG: ATP-binding protein, partial [Thermosphaera sp.]
MDNQLTLFSAELCQSLEAQRRWENLTDLHERNRDELLNKVREFIEGMCGSGKEECWMPVIYGVYGSGKTTLLVELCEWSLRNSVPSVRVNLSRIVNYIKEKRKGRTITEEDLPKYVEEFFQEYLSSKLPKELFESIKGRKGVLIIDEVEESFEELKNLVSGRSILRSLADNVRTGSSKVLMVLGFAPSSILAEAVLQYATSWRVKLISVPQVSTDVIRKKYVQDYPLNDKLKKHEREIKTLVSNALWWLSKGGRPGWLDKLKREKVIESLFSTINYLASNNNFRGIGLCYEPPQDQVLSQSIEDTLKTKPVEGAPLFDYEEYREMLRNVRKELKDVPADKSAIMEALVKLLTCLVGPVSGDLLKTLLGSEIPSGLKPSDVVVRKEELIDMNILVDTYVKALKQNFNLESDLITNIEEYLKSILQPWSVDHLMIYDRDELKILLEEVFPLLIIENIQEKLLDYVGKLDIDKILRDAYRERPPLNEGRDYYSLRVKTLRSLYKPVIVTPLIGCSKGVNLDKMINDIKRDDLHKSTILKELKENLNLDIYPLLSVKNLKGVNPESQVLQGVTIVFLLFTNIPSLREEAEEVKKELEKRYRGLLDRYWVFRLELPPILAQYLIGY